MKYIIIDFKLIQCKKIQRIPLDAIVCQMAVNNVTRGSSYGMWVPHLLTLFLKGVPPMKHRIHIGKLIF